LVNINAASSAGVSLNHYAQFNTDQRGAILNNSSTASQTQLGGTIGGNANMANGPARIIINQVVGQMPSTLAGSIEVAGRRAEVVVSNPNGITVNGAGFINTSRAVLTTAKPGQFDLNGIKTMRHAKGTIVVNKLDARGVEQLDLVGRVVKINGEIHADNILNVIAGGGEFNYRAADAVEHQVVMDGPEVAVGIDVAALGGMYAKKISLITNQDGFGVNIAGIVDAREALRVDSAGNVSLQESARVQGGNINIASMGSIRNSGVVGAVGQARLTSAGTLSNDGTVTSKDKLWVSVAGELRNALNGVMQGEKNVEVVGNSIVQAGKVTAGADMLMKTTGRGSLVNSGTVKAGKELDIRSDGGFSNTATGVLSAADVNVEARRTLSNEGLIEATAGNADIYTRGKLINAGTGVIQASKRAQLFSEGDAEQNGLVKGKIVRLVSHRGGFANTGTVQASDLVSLYASDSFESSGTLTAPSIVNE